MEEITLTEELAAIEILKRTTDLSPRFEIHIKLKKILIAPICRITYLVSRSRYLRIIGSIKAIFSTRLKIYHKYRRASRTRQKAGAVGQVCAKTNQTDKDQFVAV